MNCQLRDPKVTPPSTSAGSRRPKFDLAKFSLDLSWARGVSDFTRNRAYPSPPMSGSPSHPARHKNDFDDRGYGGFGGPLHARAQTFGGIQTDERDLMRNPNVDGYAQNSQTLASGWYQQGASTHIDQANYHYPPQPQGLSQQRALPPYQFSSNLQPVGSFATDRVQNTAPPEPTAAPKTQRKTKGHVASACVPCKRAHLRCDAMRPCSRCVSGGKEDLCIDMVHKKRGRPRLRDDRERFEPNLYTQGPELLRRPLSMYPTESHMVSSDPLTRSSYRVLKSQSGSALATARFIDHASVADANIYPAPSQRQMPTQETACAYLNMDFQILKANKPFCDSIGVPQVISRKLQDVVTMGHREKVDRLKQALEELRQKREPQLLPPIYRKVEEDRVIQLMEFNRDDIARIPPDRHETLSFQAVNGDHRHFDVRMSLGKKQSTYFVFLRLVGRSSQPEAPPQQYPFSSFGREQQYSFQPPFQTGYMPQPQHFMNYQYAPQMQVPAQPQAHTFDDFRPQDQSLMYRPMTTSTTPMQHTMPLATPMQHPEVLAYSRPSSSASVVVRPDYSQAQPQMQYATLTPRSEAAPEVQQARPQTAQSELQLPPIRNQGSPTMLSNIGRNNMMRDDSRASRLDIGGLLERPGVPRRQ